MRVSCNTAFGGLGLKLGASALHRQAEAFGFGSSVHIPMSVAPSVFPSDIPPPQVAFSAIGQYSDAVTPLQMAMVAAAVGNGGRVMQPYLVARTLAPDLSTLSTTNPHPLGQAVRPDVAAELTQMMEAVVTGGTGTAAQIPGVTVAGKTGTAENGPGRQPTHAWFIGFAPAQNPQVAVAVLVEHGGIGGQTAAPIARQVFRRGALRRMSLAPELTVGERYRLVARIAVGGMGEVWRARDELLDRDVAVKVLKEEYAADPDVPAPLSQRGQAHGGAVTSRHRKRLRLWRSWRDRYLVMELVPGEPLSTVIAREAPLPAERCSTSSARPGSLCGRARHRRRPPRRQTGQPAHPTGRRVKVTDFGIARAIDSAPVTQTGMLWARRRTVAGAGVRSRGRADQRCLLARCRHLRVRERHTPVRR